MKSILCIVNPVSGLKKSLKVYYEVEKKNFRHLKDPNFLLYSIVLPLKVIGTSSAFELPSHVDKADVR